MYDWSKPITYEEFKSYPHDIQVECLQHFKDKHKCGRNMMSEMLGVSSTTLAKYLEKNDLVGNLAGYPTKEISMSFSFWLASFKSEPASVVVEEPPVESPKEKPVLATLNPIFTQSVKKGNLLMSGKGSEIAQTLWGIFQNENVRMMIDFELLEDEE